MTKTHYKIEIRWSHEDKVYLAHIPELEITTHANTPVKAVEMAQEAIELHLETLKELRLEPPVPAADRKFKGQFPLRLGKRRHEDVFIRAKAKGLSMNEYVVSLIDKDLGEGDYSPKKSTSFVKSPRKSYVKKGKKRRHSS